MIFAAPSPSRPIEAGDLLLRPFEAADEPAVAAALANPDILRWAVSGVVRAVPEAERARHWLRSRTTGRGTALASFAVVDAADGTLLGSVSLRDIHRIPDQAVAAYWVTPAARGRGVAGRALDALMGRAFAAAVRGGLGLHRVTLDHVLVNTASCRVAEKAGFLLEGTMRDSFVDCDGVRHDSHLHARLATDGR
ncbi:GNAT family N-acetyltransferase [Actinomadura atramentaria]|uniref:GNAT family N-acetyltransferase n=1 Tax=Actinomadura atramentaria TaxID=1990 RepID=UPI00036EA87C|nr:GNAT family protein [Actinomadura atramentaria]